MSIYKGFVVPCCLGFFGNILMEKIDFCFIWLSKERNIGS
jgi:hypothetical protein